MQERKSRDAGLSAKSYADGTYAASEHSRFIRSAPRDTRLKKRTLCTHICGTRFIKNHINLMFHT